MLCYYGDDMEEYRRWEDNIKMDLKEIGVDVMSYLVLFPFRFIIYVAFVNFMFITFRTLVS